MNIIENYIGGEFVPSSCSDYLDNVCPATGEIYSKTPNSNADDVNKAVSVAKRVFSSWKNTTTEERSQFLHRIADLIERDLELFAKAESYDQGKPVWLARKLDIPRAIANFRFFADAIRYKASESYNDNIGILNYTERKPIGVCALISPWNLPLYLLTWKIAPALATGNTAVCKPSELTPMTAYLLSKVMHESGLPAGVCNIVFGLGKTAGNALTAHPDVPVISFTGGTDTAKAISFNAHSKFKKLSLELGGKNPSIIFADCNYEKALNTAIKSAFTNQGEICLCTERFLVEDSIYETFANDFSKKALEITVGDPKKETTLMGPLVSRQHLNKVEAYIHEAILNGAKILCGGKRAKVEGFEGGYYLKPTVLTATKPSDRINQQEVFGPVVTVMPFKTVSEAIALANNVEYGLSATVWTTDVNKAHNVSSALEVGQVWVNTWLERDLRVPFGGIKSSGLGREGGNDSLNFFTETKNICLDLNMIGG